jgi:hypothetical protein
MGIGSCIGHNENIGDILQCSPGNTPSPELRDGFSAWCDGASDAWVSHFRKWWWPKIWPTVVLGWSADKNWFIICAPEPQRLALFGGNATPCDPARQPAPGNILWLRWLTGLSGADVWMVRKVEGANLGIWSDTQPCSLDCLARNNRWFESSHLRGPQTLHPAG